MKTIHGLTAVISCLLATSLMAKDLTVVSFGGAYGAAQKKHMIDPLRTLATRFYLKTIQAVSLSSKRRLILAM